MSHQIKIKRAIKQADFLPTAVNHILRNIPDSVISALTAQQLAELMQAMNRHYHEGKQAAEKELAAHMGLPASASIWDALGQ